MSSQSILQTDVAPEAFGQRAERRLYVEGEPDSIDREVVSILTKGLGLSISSLGTSSNIRVAVNALHADHPTYAYLIDRDYLDTPLVEDAWRDFPNPNKGNLLIWRKRSIENYFLDVEWLSKSNLFVQEKKAYLIQKLERVARERVFLDAANLTVGIARGTLFKNSMTFDNNAQRYRSLAEGKAALLARQEWQSIPETIASAFAHRNIETIYENFVADMLGPAAVVPKYGHGTWADCMDAKPLANAIFESSAFKVPSNSGARKLSALEKRSAIVRDLIESGVGLPNDFTEVRRMLEAHMARSI